MGRHPGLELASGLNGHPDCPRRNLDLHSKENPLGDKGLGWYI
jgi:hypothetical protein